MTQPFPFEEPSNQQGDRFTAEHAQNRRLIVVPIEYVPAIRTARGDEVDAIRVNVVDLQGGQSPIDGAQDEPGTRYMGTLWFGGRLIGAFRNSLGKSFLGFVTKERTQGGFQAWQFHSLTQDQDTVTMAQQWLAQNPDFLETCQGDVDMAARNAAQAQQAPQGNGWQQGQVQGQAAYPTPPPPPPAPPRPAGPAPAPAPAPMQQAPQSPAPPPPKPIGNRSVMERLRAQNQGQQPVEPPQDAPF